jgi:hypothetical protein
MNKDDILQKLSQEKEFLQNYNTPRKQDNFS